MPSPNSRPQNQYRASTPPPQVPKKRSSNEAGNDDVEVRIAQSQVSLSAKYLPNTILTPSGRPKKKVKISPEFQTDTLSLAPPSWKPQKIPQCPQSFQLSATQLDVLQHLPPSPLLMNAAAYLSEGEPLLASSPSAGSKRAWVEAVKDDAWECSYLAGPMPKRPRIEKGLHILH